MIILVNVVDQILGRNGAVTYATVLFKIANGGLSIIENLAKVDVLVPSNLANKLKHINEESSKSVTEELREEFNDKEEDK